MDILNIKRWHWIAISLIIGLAMGYVMQLPRSSWTRAFGDTVVQQYFEEGLLKEQNGLRWFRNIVVYPEMVPFEGRKRPIYIVAGQYFNGRLEMQNGQQVAVWRPRCYIAELPYRPWTRITPGAPDPDTVLTYLDSLKGKGVTYTYAWWRDPRWAMTFWTAGSLILIGLVWPSIINLLAFGSLFRPREAKGIDLSTAPTPVESHQPQVTAGDMAKVQQMSDELQAGLSSQAAPTATLPATQEPSEIRKLDADKLEITTPGQSGEAKEFGKTEDDYYPTERHAQPPNRAP